GESRKAHTDTERAWVVEVPDGGDERARVAESLLTVADGVVGTRGSLEEDGASTVPATYPAGVYESAPEVGQALVALPGWACLPIVGLPVGGSRWLDLRAGVVRRTVASAQGAVMRSARWACLERPGTEVLVAECSADLLPLDKMIQSTVRVHRRTELGGWVEGVVGGDAASGPAGPGESATTASCTVASYAVGTGPSDGADAEVARAHEAARRVGPAALLAEQRDAWTRRWASSDIEVVGDVEVTRAARFALFQLAGVAAGRGEAAVGARGLTGQAYSGHVFWDADVFVLPALAATCPPAARAMLEYRIRRLPAARRAAAELGRRGARFPWESAADGTDVTPRTGVNELGERVPILTGDLEEHITADVAWSAWHFAAVTGEWSFLDGAGGSLVVDTARYWASRVRLDRAGEGHIDTVIGPDEYHETVDDNAFTNLMAAWNLRRGAELLERMSTGRSSLKARRACAEAAEWRALADVLVTGYNPATRRHEQFAGYDELEPLVAGDVSSVPFPADLVLGRQRLAGSQIVKQADVLMAHHLVPEVMEPGSLQGDVAFYVPRTSHGSSLSPAVHASVLARAGRVEQAMEYLELARRVDLDDLTGTSSDGLHMGALGGLWQALVFGFAGLRVERPDDTTLALYPQLPDHWKELRIRLVHHGRSVQLRCRNDAVHVTCSEPLTVVAGTAEPHRLDGHDGWVEVQRGGE
ncbi:MAG TPA: glycosyl hydrolase family 65 protein, partial [Acidimicrobiales bacterium]|nr:glycosyl hydrolase family 65 protein [Acidimicrobiales bacterium]